MALPVSECELKVGLEDRLLEFAHILNCDESSTMSAEASSLSDDARETNTSEMDSYHGVQKDGEAVHRRRTMETNEPTPIRAASNWE